MPPAKRLERSTAALLPWLDRESPKTRAHPTDPDSKNMSSSCVEKNVKLKRLFVFCSCGAFQAWTHHRVGSLSIVLFALRRGRTNASPANNWDAPVESPSINLELAWRHVFLE
jgi:hypothetical protein